MTILPGLTSTRTERIPVFIEDLLRYGVTAIALFPTCLDSDARSTLYRQLETVPGLRIPHVHLRTDCDSSEIEYLTRRFATEAFNIHPASSTHPFGEVPPRFRKQIFIENVEVLPEDVELEEVGGLCPDYAHLENARLHGRAWYTRRMTELLSRFSPGCSHISAIRNGFPNSWKGEWDHHEFVELEDLSYMRAYRSCMPGTWASLELENPLREQLDAIEYLRPLLA